MTRTRTARREAGAVSSGLYRRLVLGTMEKMKEGYLQLELPCGTMRHFGDPEAEPKAHLQIRNESFFKRVLLFGDIGFGEAYVHGDWESGNVERVIAWAIANLQNSPFLSGSKARRFGLNLLRLGNRLQHRLRPNSIATAKSNIAQHYDLGNAFYSLWLDRTMTYSAARFTNQTRDLEAAQIEKYDALCRKLDLKATDRVLEIGCGWGGFAEHATRRYGCQVTCITISDEQFHYARARMERAGLTDRATVQLLDYRKVRGQFDKIVSIEMMEAVGERYLEVFFRKIHEVLAPDGLLAVQFITVPDCRRRELTRGVDWIQKHIFPGSLLLSLNRVGTAISRTGDLFVHHLEDLGADYARTLRHWYENFQRELDGIRQLGFDGEFIRKWSYYLQYCEAAFAMRNISVVQAIYTRPNNLRLPEISFR
ncbi:MAG: cyclopropane-fatty-acyl-phospholipid synthase family protein [Chthoniobacteraceae bacterium]